MLTVLGITGPIFIIIAIGFMAARRGMLRGGDARALGVFVIDFALPALLFRAMSQRSLGQLLNFELLLAYTLGTLAVLIIGIGIGCLVQRRGLQAATILAMGMTISNSAFIAAARLAISAVPRATSNSFIRCFWLSGGASPSLPLDTYHCVQGIA